MVPIQDKAVSEKIYSRKEFNTTQNKEERSCSWNVLFLFKPEENSPKDQDI